MSGDTSVEDIGEFGLIERIAALVGPSTAHVGMGDDAAVIDQGGDWYLLATIDSLVQDVHFRIGDDAPEHLGARAMAINLSDIAAMGGSPSFALIALSVPKDASLVFVEGLYRGIVDEASRFGVGIVGGNTTRSPSGIVIDVALWGRVPKDEVVLRSGAAPGDVLAVTGFLGGAAAHRLLREAGLDSKPSPAVQPRIEAGRILAQGHFASAMMDVSDGLGADLHQLAQACEAGLVIFSTDLPVDDLVKRVERELGIARYQLALFGGEDYELLVALTEDKISGARAALHPIPLFVIGRILPAGEGIVISAEDGSRQPLPRHGWSHF